MLSKIKVCWWYIATIEMFKTIQRENFIHMEHQMIQTVILIWVIVFTSPMLCEQTTVASRYTNCKFNVTDLGCPVYDYTSWNCLSFYAACPEGTEYHCLRLHMNPSRFADGCAQSEVCLKGQMPYWPFINDGIPTHVICDWCHDTEYFNPENKLSSTYSNCPFEKVRCDYYNGFECLPENKNDIHKGERLCRCDARNNYIFGDLRRINGQICTSDRFLATHCLRAEPCKDGMERLLNYTCVDKCKNGFRSNTSDECRQFYTQPPIIEPIERPDEPILIAHSTISSKVSSSTKETLTTKKLPTLKFQVIQTTTKPIHDSSSSINLILSLGFSMVVILLLAIATGLFLRWWSKRKDKGRSAIGLFLRWWSKRKDKGRSDKQEEEIRLENGIEEPCLKKDKGEKEPFLENAKEQIPDSTFISQPEENPKPGHSQASNPSITTTAAEVEVVPQVAKSIASEKNSQSTRIPNAGSFRDVNPIKGRSRSSNSSSTSTESENAVELRLRPPDLKAAHGARPKDTDTFEEKQSEDDGRIQVEDVAWIKGQLEVNAEKLTKGSTGTVYLLKDTARWGGKVVVKRIKGSKNFNPITNEIVAARIRHHFIVPLLAKCKSDTHYYFVFPYMEKGELMNAIEDDNKRIKNGERVHLNATKRVTILYQIACAMLYIHTPVGDWRNTFVHGDITSKNIVLDGKYNARLLDFGIARELKPGQKAVNVQIGDQIGTPGYMTASSQTELSTETDCRNFGVVIKEMLTGSEPIAGNMRLQTTPISTEGGGFSMCFQNVWKSDEDVYDKLGSLANKCCEKEIDSSSIAEELYGILEECNQVIKTKALGDTKCSVCMLNRTVADTNLCLQNCLNNSSHEPPPVCVACMRNSYLNPIQCLRCRMTIPTKIGFSWAAILIGGYEEDEKYSRAIETDVNNMKQILTSKYPLVTGLSERNVITTTLDEFDDEMKKIEKCSTLFTVIVYYSGHYSKDLGFQVAKNIYFSIEDFEKCLGATKKDIILIMDCCSSPSLGHPDANIKLQLNASRSNEVAIFTSEKGSAFTELFVETLLKKSTDSCSKDNPSFISVVTLFNQICKGMKNKTPGGGSNPTVTLNNANTWDLNIGYTHKITGMKFHFEDTDEHFKVDTLNTPIKLKAALLKQVLKKKYKGDSFENHTLKKYSDIIVITVRKGPHEKGIHELSSIEELTITWNQKFELSFGLRNIENIHNNTKIGAFLDKINTHDLLQRYLKHLGELSNEETIVKVQWTNKKELLAKLNKLKPTEKQSQDAAYQWLSNTLDKIDQNHKIKEASHIVFTVLPGLWKEDANDFLTIELEGLKLETDSN